MDLNLETERLFIRNGTLDDFKKVYEYNFTKLEDIAGIFEYEKQDANQIESWFDYNIDEYYEKLRQVKNFDLILFLKENNEPIGNLLIDCLNEDENSIELTCHVHPNFWGNGYMQEAILKVIPILFDLGFDNIIYSYGSGNVKSAKLCAKLGFELSSIKKNDYIRNGIPVDIYRNILSKEKFYELGNKKVK